MANWDGYVAFWDATAVYRKWGFRSFLTTCVTFVGTFVVSVWERTKDDQLRGQVIMAMSVTLALLGAYHIRAVLKLATKFIFTT